MSEYFTNEARRKQHNTALFPYPRVRHFPRLSHGNAISITHTIHISKSAIAALTLPLAPSAIWRVMAMGAPKRRARNAARTSFSGGWTRTDWKQVWNRSLGKPHDPASSGRGRCEPQLKKSEDLRNLLGKVHQNAIFLGCEVSTMNPSIIAIFRHNPRQSPWTTPVLRLLRCFYLFLPALRSGHRILQRPSPQKQFL